MRNAAVITTMILLAMTASTVKASIIFTLNSPAGDQGKSHTYTVGGVSVIAYAEGTGSQIGRAHV